MVKKILILGITVLLLFLTACNVYPVDKFDSLEEMQAVLPKDMYYFDFEQEEIKEAGNFEATKTSNNKMEDGNYNYFRYSIWYDVEYEIDGQKQERKLRIVATYHTKPLSFGYKSTGNYSSILNPIHNSWVASNTGFDAMLGFDENKKALLFTITINENRDYYYYFALEGVQANFVEHELESLHSICEFAITNRYQIT